MRIKRTRLILLFCVLFSALSLCGCSLRTLLLGKNRIDSVITDTQTEADKNIIHQSINFNGYEWTICMPWASEYIPNGDDTQRDKKLSDLYDNIGSLYNVNITIKQSSGLQDYMTMAFAGRSSADVIGISAREIVPLAVNNFIYSVEDPVMLAAGLNFEDNTKWYKDISRLVTWNNKQWAVQIGSTYDIPEFGSFILYRYSIEEKLQIDSLINMVKAGQWTNEKYFELSQQAEGSDKAIKSTMLLDGALPILANSGQMVREKDGVWQNSVKDSQTIDAISILEKFKKLKCSATEPSPEAVEEFCEGNIAFLWTNSDTLLEYPCILDVDGGCGILPIPNDSGTNFACPVCSYSGYGFMTTNESLNKSVTVFNKLAEKVSEDWFSFYIKKTGLDNKSIEMLDLILPNKVFNNAKFNNKFEDIFNQHISTPILKNGKSVEDITERASHAMDKAISQLNLKNKTGGT